MNNLTLSNMGRKISVLAFLFLLIFPMLTPALVSADNWGAVDAQERAKANQVAETDGAAGGFFNGVFLKVGNLIMGIGAMITWFGGKFLEITIDKLILNLGSLLRSGIGASIEVVWTLIRDMANLIFIFGFIYIGISTIINADNSQAKRMLASIIIGALLINFSLYFTKIVIDVSNYLSVEIYKSLLADSSSVSISSKFADVLGIVGIFQMPDPTKFANMTGGGNLSFFFMGAIFMTVTGFVLAAGAVLIIIRFVALVFIMVFSPILFAATVFPQTQSMASDLWKKLINYSLFAPAYLILLTVSLKLLEGFMNSFNPTHATLSSAFVGKADSFGIIMVFVTAIIFMMMSLKIATNFGIHGANTVTGYAKKGMGAFSAGLAARAGRATFGRAANWLSEKDGLKDAAAQRGARGWAARQTLKSSRVVADSSLDARNAFGLGSTLGVGEGRKGGYKTVKDEVKKKEEEFAKSLGEIEDDDVQVKARKEEHVAAEKELRSKEENLRKLRDAAKKERDKYAPGATRTPADQKALDDAEKAVLDAREDIEDHKGTIDKKKAAYEKEKMRRVIGSSYAKPATHHEETDLGKLNGAVKTQEDKIKGLWKGYTGLSEADQEKRRGDIEAENTKLEELKKKRDAFEKAAVADRGYAGVLDNESIWTSWPVGRLARNNRYAGKKMRESRSKGAPKKDD